MLNRKWVCLFTE